MVPFQLYVIHTSTPQSGRFSALEKGFKTNKKIGLELFNFGTEGTLATFSAEFSARLYKSVLELLQINS